jgi:hypothetical protein
MLPKGLAKVRRRFDYLGQELMRGEIAHRADNTLF